jgi:hypothetical protein
MEGGESRCDGTRTFDDLQVFRLSANGDVRRGDSASKQLEEQAPLGERSRAEIAPTRL